MKKIILILLIVQCSFCIAEAQWIIQPTGNIHDIRDVEFINRYTGWACGDNYIYKTTNGGNNWIEQPHPYAYTIQQIFPVNDRVIYACGIWNFMKTTNAGDNWTAIFAGGAGQGLPELEALYFIDENTGWLAGNVVVMKTTNGGNSFVDSMRIEGDVRDIYFKDSLNGVACGMVADFQKTTNGGRSWNELEIIKNGWLYDFIRLGILNDNVWVGGKSIYKSTNFGISFDSIGLIPTLFENVTMYGLSFTSNSTGYTAGNRGEMYKTTDGGYNWKRENSGSSTSIIFSIEAYNDSVIWASRGNGTIIHTVNGGQTYIKKLNSFQTAIYKLCQNYPNPFNPTTNIEFAIPKDNFVSLKIYNLLGKEIMSLVNEFKQAGSYTVTFDAANYPSGVYYYKIHTGSFVQVRKMILIK